MRISRVTPGSAADRSGLAAGDVVTAIDGTPVHDFLDFYLASFGTGHTVRALRRGKSGQFRLVRAGGDTGLELETGRCKVCGNRCVFCFVDQLPRGLRRSLYVKDEDYRLSFLHGNYLTLTNLAPEDERRIVRDHLSPLYVSVHSTDEAARGRLLGRRPAEPILEVLGRLGKKGIRFHAQVVVVPGYNDGALLARTLGDLAALAEVVRSVSVVPVGLTAHRAGLPALSPVPGPTAALIAGQVARLNASMRRRTGRGMFYVSDEMIILGGRRFPPASYYDDFPQIENGVGLVRTMLDQIGGLRVPAALRGARAALVTGRLAAPFVERLARLLRRRGVPARTAAVGNRLFGPSVTVSGLLGGSDVVEALRPLREADVVVLPPDMFNCDLVTLDGMTPSEISGRLGRRVAVAGHGLQATLAGIAATLGGD